uniref:Uncharacterized protein n=1 Tax=Parascaris equorum TaxID=6256 RepID=A0A914RH11_PAREQ
MANIYHQAGLLHSALIAGGAALGISPKLVAIHFTLANIYASMHIGVRARVNGLNAIEKYPLEFGTVLL